MYIVYTKSLGNRRICALFKLLILHPLPIASETTINEGVNTAISSM